MTIVTAQMSVSVDGFYAGPEHTGTQPWLEGAEAAGFFRVTRWVIDAEAWRQRLGFKGGEQSTNSQVIAETFGSAGAYVMGRRMADGGEVPWGDEPPFRAPVFVVTHRPRKTLHRQGGTSFTYVTDGIESAIGQARTAANGKNVAIAGGGTLLRQVIGLGLLDELELHVVPVILGDGMRLLGPGLGLDDMEAIELTPISATRSTAGARLCSMTEDGTSSPPPLRPGRRDVRCPGRRPRAGPPRPGRSPRDGSRASRCSQPARRDQPPDPDGHPPPSRVTGPPSHARR
jgi:dihydrofolate reductase